MTTLTCLLNTNVICHLVFQCVDKIETYTALNTAIESFFTNQGEMVNTPTIDYDYLKKRITDFWASKSNH